MFALKVGENALRKRSEKEGHSLVFQPSVGTVVHDMEEVLFSGMGSRANAELKRLREDQKAAATVSEAHRCLARHIPTYWKSEPNLD